MKIPASLIFIVSGLLCYSQTSPERIVQQQLDAYNRQDLKAFLSTYSDSIEIYNFNNHELISKGKSALEKDYAQLFKSAPENYAALRGRIVQGNFVIDKEYVTGREYNLEATAIYEVENGLIVKIWFVW